MNLLSQGLLLVKISATMYPCGNLHIIYNYKCIGNPSNGCPKLGGHVGLTENAGQENDGQTKSRGWKMRD